MVLMRRHRVGGTGLILRIGIRRVELGMGRLRGESTRMEGRVGGVDRNHMGNCVWKRVGGVGLVLGRRLGRVVVGLGRVGLGAREWIGRVALRV